MATALNLEQKICLAWANQARVKVSFREDLPQEAGCLYICDVHFSDNAGRSLQASMSGLFSRQSIVVLSRSSTRAVSMQLACPWVRRVPMYLVAGVVFDSPNLRHYNDEAAEAQVIPQQQTEQTQVSAS